MLNKRVLILGGTREAREVAAALMAAGIPAVTSLAGVTETPVLPEGEVRRGGFGGVTGLTSYLRAERIALTVDATHPFAARISVNAVDACRDAGVPLLRLERPPWTPQEGDRWTQVKTVEEAAARLRPAARVLLTIGRKEIAPFMARSGIGGIARMIEPPPLALPPGWSLILERPPFSIGAEKHLLAQNAIGWLVTKNAGGGDTDAKLVAARELDLPVIMIEQPAKPFAPIFASTREIFLNVKRVLSP